MVKYYAVNSKTLAIIPIGNKQSKIIENNREFIINNSPQKLIVLNCENAGTTYEIQKKISSKLIHANYKVPILIDRSERLIFFPTSSPRQYSCCWINYKEINNIYINKRMVSTINFIGGKRIELDASLNVLSNQLLKSNYLNFRLKEIY